MEERGGSGTILLKCATIFLFSFYTNEYITLSIHFLLLTFYIFLHVITNYNKVFQGEKVIRMYFYVEGHRGKRPKIILFYVIFVQLMGIEVHTIQYSKKSSVTVVTPKLW